MTGETPPAAKGVTEAATALVNFAWSLVVTDCTESAEYLNELVDNLRVALRDVPGQASEEIPEGWAGDGLRSFLAEKAGRASLPAPGEGEATPVAWLKPSDIERLAKMQRGAINAQIANLSFVGCTVPVYSTPASGGLAVKVKPLDESKTQGWRDDRGNFCLPLSDGYYIKFPSEKTLPERRLFMVWYYTDPIGGHAEMAIALKVAQDHHRSRILSALDRTTLPTAEGWKTMNSAPKNGGKFLAYEKGRYFDCWWHENDHGEAYWMDEADSELNPSHWRDLPAAPHGSL